ncbi:F-box/LRR-repeat protein 17 [Umbelopsis sp. WA50703]
MAPSSLPPEILHSILDKLLDDDADYFADILACSLVSQTWNDVVAYVLSRSLNVVTLRGGHVENLLRLSALLETIAEKQITLPYSPDDIKTISLDMSYLFKEDGSYDEKAQEVLIHLIEMLCTQTTGLELSFNHPVALLNWQEDRLKDFYQSLEKATKLMDSVERLALQGMPRKDSAFVICNYGLTHLFPTFSPKLRSLEFANFPLRYAVYLLLQSCQELENVTFKDFRNLWEDGLVEAITHWSKLRSYTMTGCVHTTPLVLRSLASHCPDLEELVVPRNMRYSKSCPDINDSMINVVENCTKLSKLDLSDYESIDDSLLQVIVEHARNLRYLNLQNCKRITGKQHLAWWNEQSLQHLEVLDVTGCGDLTDSFVKHVATQRKGLKIIETASSSQKVADLIQSDRCVYIAESDRATVPRSITV